MKKLISVALATIMIASLICTAFATSTLTRTSNMTGKYNAPTIDVTIPTTGNVVLNPYKLSYNVAADGEAADMKSDYIVFKEAQIVNKSNVGVEISAVVTGKPTNITLEKATVKKDDGTDAKTTKSAYMYVQFANATYSSGSVTGNYASDTPTFTATTTQAVDAVLIQSTASKATTVLKLDAPTTASGSGGAITDADATYGTFKITGDIVSKPATAYDSKDKVDVTIAWTIIPLVTESTASGGTVSGG